MKEKVSKSLHSGCLCSLTLLFHGCDSQGRAEYRFLHLAGDHFIVLPVLCICGSVVLLIDQG